MHMCSVFGCKNEANHSFPKENHVRELWELATGRKDFRAKKHSKICSAHFKSDDYIEIGRFSGLKNTRRILKKGIVPSIFPGTKTDNLKSITSSETAALDIGVDCVKEIVAQVNNPKLVQAHIDAVRKCSTQKHYQFNTIESFRNNDKDSSFKCTECCSFSIGPMVTCVQCSDITICLKCDREGRHQFHCLLKMPTKQYMDTVKDYLSKVRELFARLLINFKDEEEKQKTEFLKKETRKAKNFKAKVREIPTTKLQKQKTTLTSNPHLKETSECRKHPVIKQQHLMMNQQQLITNQPRRLLKKPTASQQGTVFVNKPTTSSNVVFQTLSAPQFNVPVQTSGVTSTSMLSTAADEVGDPLVVPAKRTADDVKCLKRLTVERIKVEIKEEEMYEVEILDEPMMVVGDVKTEPPEELTIEIDPGVIRTEKNSY